MVLLSKLLLLAYTPMEAVHLLEAILVISFIIAILQLTHTNSVYLENLSQRIKMEPTGDVNIPMVEVTQMNFN
jgi:hypothetical protein